MSQSCWRTYHIDSNIDISPYTISFSAEMLAKSFLVSCVLILATSSTHGDVEESWAKLQISSNVLGSMKYGNFRVNVYEHAANSRPDTLSGRWKKYFYAPVAVLDHESATSGYNAINKRYEMDFEIVMWNEALSKEVAAFVSDLLNETVSLRQVQIIPFHKVMLINNVLPDDGQYRLSGQYQSHESVSFTIVCSTRQDCDRLAEHMRDKPADFAEFQLVFTLDSQKASTRMTSIRVETVASGELMTRLLQAPASTRGDIVYLTTNDAKRLVSEMASNILVDSFDDSEIVSPQSTNVIEEKVRQMLGVSWTTVNREKGNIWGSVFWNEDNYRPDVVVRTLNDHYKKLNTSDRQVLADAYKITNKFALGVGGRVDVNLFGVLPIGGAQYEAKLDTDSSLAGESRRDLTETFYNATRDTVEWNGQKFVPKNLNLTRFNLANVRNEQTWKDKSVSVRYVKAELTIAVNIPSNKTSLPGIFSMCFY